MAFEKGHRPKKKTGAVKICRDYIEAHPFLVEFTAKDAYKVLREASLPDLTKQKASNVMNSLAASNTVRETGRFGKNRVKIYLINRNDSEAPSEEKETPAAVSAPGGEIVEDKASVNTLEKNIKELEDQLLEEMQKAENQQIAAQQVSESQAIEIEALKKTIERLEKGLEMDFFTFGKSVFKAHQDLLQRYNQLEATHRDEVAKLTKMRSDDRQMIGGLQKKIRDLEADNRAMRIRLQSNVTNEKPDLSIFNPPRLGKGGGHES